MPTEIDDKEHKIFRIYRNLTTKFAKYPTEFANLPFEFNDKGTRFLVYIEICRRNLQNFLRNLRIRRLNLLTKAQDFSYLSNMPTKFAKFPTKFENLPTVFKDKGTRFLVSIEYVDEICKFSDEICEFVDRI